MTNYTFKQAHYPNNVSWYRELISLDDNVVGEIMESVESTSTNKIYRVRKYAPLQVSDGVIEVLYDVEQFSTVSDCKEFINSGGIA